VTDLVELSPVALKILDEIRSDHRPQPAPRIAVIGEVVGVIKILFD